MGEGDEKEPNPAEGDLSKGDARSRRRRGRRNRLAQDLWAAPERDRQGTSKGPVRDQ